MPRYNLSHEATRFQDTNYDYKNAPNKFLSVGLVVALVCTVTVD